MLWFGRRDPVDPRGVGTGLVLGFAGLTSNISAARNQPRTQGVPTGTGAGTDTARGA